MRRHRPIALSIAALVGAGAVAVLGSLRERPPELSPRAELATALGGLRAGPGRLTGIDHAPVEATTQTDRDESALRAASGKIKRHAEHRPSPEALSDLAVLRLVEGRIEEAVELLQRAAQAAPSDAKVLSDLAVAYLASAAADPRRAIDLARGLDAAARACMLSPDSLASRFNLATALQQLGLAGAQDAWRLYLEQDPASAWAREAKRHLEEVSRPTAEARWLAALPALRRAALAGDTVETRRLVRRFSQQARRQVEDALLPQAAVEALGGDRESLVIARGIGEALLALSGEGVVLDAVAAIEEAAARSDRQRWLAGLARGHRAYREGVQLLERYDVERAAAAFGVARDELRRAGSSFAAWAEARLVECDLQRYRYAAAAATLEGILTEAAAPARARPILEARALWLRGLIALSRSRHEEALADFQRSRSLFERAGEAEHVAALEELVFEYYHFSGQHERSWEPLLSALRGVRDMASRQRRYRVATAGAAAALSVDLPHAALWFQNEALRWARQHGHPMTVALALRRLATVHDRLGLREAALRDLAAAREETEKLPAGSERSGLLGDVLLVTAELALPQRPHAAIALYTEALAIFRETEYHLEFIRTLAGRARAHRAAGAADDAEADLEEAIAELGEQRRRLRAGSRVAFADSLKSVFAEMAQLQIEVHGRPQRAYAYAEQAQARDLSELALGGPQSLDEEALSADDVRRALPPGTLLVQFLVSDEESYAWSISPGGVEFAAIPEGRSALARRARAFRRAIDADALDLRAQAQDLHDLLLAPFERGLAGASAIVIVPDGPLHDVPFAALRSRTSGRFLVEDWAVVAAPSARLFLDALERSRARPQPREPRALLIGNPAFDRERFSDLDDLPAAEREAAEIGGLYRRKLVLLREEATEEAFLSLVPRHDVIHVGAHGVSNRAAPDLSYLLLAPGGAPEWDGTLYAHELYGSALAGPSVVVLAACAAGAGAVSDTEGPMSLARPFIAAGVPNVVAPLWKIDDRYSRPLLVEFHRRLNAGSSPMAALREAQRVLLYGKDPELAVPRSWAAFQLIGSGLPGRDTTMKTGD